MTLEVLDYLIVFLVLMPCVHTECISKQPPCYVPSYDPNANNSYNREQLTKAIVHVTRNLSVYESTTAVFKFEVSHFVISDAIPVVYVDGCEDNLMGQSCELINDTIIECRYTNVTIADNEKKIVFYTYSPSVLKGAKLCHQPFSYLTVLGEPVTVVNVSYSLNCDSIHLLTSQTNDSTYTEYKLLDHNGHLLLEDGYNSTIDSVLIPSHVLYNHTGVYRVIVTPTNPAGDGPSTEMILNLSAINNLVLPNVTNITVKARDNEFVGQIFVKINSTCPLTIPNYIYVNSSCSDIERHEINMDHTLNDNHIILSHRLQSYKHNCSITVSDNTGNNQSFVNSISTFHTQSHDIQVDSDGGSVNVTCTFISDTTAKGCAIVIYNKQFNKTKPVHIRTELYPVDHSDEYINIGPISPGHYSLHICDAMRDDTLDCPDAVVVFKEDFTIKRHPVTTSTIFSSRIHPSASTTISSLKIPSVPPSPYAENSAKPKNDLPIALISSAVSLVVIITLIIILIIAVVLIISIMYGPLKGRDSRSTNYDDHQHDGERGGVYMRVSDQQPAVNGHVHVHVPVTDPAQLPDNLPQSEPEPTLIDKDPYDTPAEPAADKPEKYTEKSIMPSHVQAPDTVNKKNSSPLNTSYKHNLENGKSIELDSTSINSLSNSNGSASHTETSFINEEPITALSKCPSYVEAVTSDKQGGNTAGILISKPVEVEESTKNNSNNAKVTGYRQTFRKTSLDLSALRQNVLQPRPRNASLDPRAAAAVVTAASELNQHSMVEPPSPTETLTSSITLSTDTINENTSLPSKTDSMSSQSLAKTNQTLLPPPPSVGCGSAPPHILHVPTFSIGGTQTPSPSIMANNSNPFQFPTYSRQSTITEDTVNEEYNNIPGVCDSGVMITAASTNTLKDTEGQIITPNVSLHQHLSDYDDEKCFDVPKPSQDDHHNTEDMVHTTNMSSYVNSTNTNDTSTSARSDTFLITN